MVRVRSPILRSVAGAKTPSGPSATTTATDTTSLPKVSIASS